jgi:hypothetical protein
VTYRFCLLRRGQWLKSPHNNVRDRHIVFNFSCAQDEFGFAKNGAQSEPQVALYDGMTGIHDARFVLRGLSGDHRRGGPGSHERRPEAQRSQKTDLVGRLSCVADHYVVRTYGKYGRFMKPKAQMITLLKLRTIPCLESLMLVPRDEILSEAFCGHNRKPSLRYVAEQYDSRSQAVASTKEPSSSFKFSCVGINQLSSSEANSQCIKLPHIGHSLEFKVLSSISSWHRTAHKSSIFLLSGHHHLTSAFSGNLNTPNSGVNADTSH